MPFCLCVPEKLINHLEQHNTHKVCFSTTKIPKTIFKKKNTDATVALFDQLQVDYECIDCLDEERNPGLREVFYFILFYFYFNLLDHCL